MRLVNAREFATLPPGTMYSTISWGRSWGFGWRHDLKVLTKINYVCAGNEGDRFSDSSVKWYSIALFGSEANCPTMDQENDINRRIEAEGCENLTYDLTEMHPVDDDNFAESMLFLILERSDLLWLRELVDAAIAVSPNAGVNL